MKCNIKKGEFSKLGVTKEKTWVNFCVECRKDTDCKVLIYDRIDWKKCEEITIPKDFSKGNLRAVRIDGLNLSEWDYNFKIDGKVVLDPYAVRIVGRENWGDLNRLKKGAPELRCRYEDKTFSWSGDCEVEIPRRDMVIYKLHVRGFTEGMSDKIADRGTFRGLSKKLSYLKSLGITTIELMPVYEFEELVVTKEQNVTQHPSWMEKKRDRIKNTKKEVTHKINYWGYGEGMYFAPKASYAATEDSDLELKSCILSMHKKGMECVLEMDFSDEVPAQRILNVLRYWVKEYHVDGFHLQGNKIPMEMLIQDPYLGRTKLFYREISENWISKEETGYPRIFVYGDEFLYPCRKLSCGMNGNIWELADQMKKQNERLGYVNYIADNNGFSLADLFAYENKHNEANGENNADGPEWNFSMNCGVEGETTSRNVQKIRERRMKNAIAMLFLAQGVPLLMAGDEDLNSQQGNNNAYCQDNEIGWKDWKSGKQAKEFLKYVKKLIAFRKEHTVLRMEEPMHLTDALVCGYPDLSYHEENAWISPQFFNRRALGVLYCGKYAKEFEDVYIGFNFSDFQKKLALPKQTGKRHWYPYMDTACKTTFIADAKELKEDFYTLEAQSVCIIIGR